VQPAVTNISVYYNIIFFGENVLFSFLYSLPMSANIRTEGNLSSFVNVIVVLYM